MKGLKAKPINLSVVVEVSLRMREKGPIIEHADTAYGTYAFMFNHPSWANG